MWVTPEEHATGPNRRTRLETDEEVRKRLVEHARQDPYNRLIGYKPTYRGSSGKELDELLKTNGLEPRKYVDA